MQERNQKDLDIIRQSSLKAAVELMAAFKDKVQDDGTKVVTTTLAVADQFYEWVIKPSTVNGKVEGIKKELQQDTGYNDSKPEIIDGIKRISKKQYGYLISLHRKLGREPDYNTLNLISAKDASELIESLKYQLKLGRNGNGQNGNGHRGGGYF